MNKLNILTLTFAIILFGSFASALTITDPAENIDFDRIEEPFRHCVQNQFGTYCLDNDSPQLNWYDDFVLYNLPNTPTGVADFDLFLDSTLHPLTGGGWTLDTSFSSDAFTYEYTRPSGAGDVRIWYTITRNAPLKVGLELTPLSSAVGMTLKWRWNFADVQRVNWSYSKDDGTPYNRPTKVKKEHVTGSAPNKLRTLNVHTNNGKNSVITWENVPTTMDLDTGGSLLLIWE